MMWTLTTSQYLVRFLKINQFIFGCVGSSLLHASFLQLRRAGVTLHCRMRASHCGGFSCCRTRALGASGLVVVVCGLSSCGSWALECRLSSCGARAQLLCGMWDLPGPGSERMSPALAGGFLTTAPPGKSQIFNSGRLIYQKRLSITYKIQMPARASLFFVVLASDS